jgi:quinolinate synthase
MLLVREFRNTSRGADTVCEYERGFDEDQQEKAEKNRRESCVFVHPECRVKSPRTEPQAPR